MTREQVGLRSGQGHQVEQLGQDSVVDALDRAHQQQPPIAILANQLDVHPADGQSTIEGMKARQGLLELQHELPVAPVALDHAQSLPVSLLRCT